MIDLLKTRPDNQVQAAIVLYLRSLTKKIQKLTKVFNIRVSHIVRISLIIDRFLFILYKRCLKYVIEILDTFLTII